MDDFVDYICHIASMPNVVFNVLLHWEKPGTKWIDYNRDPSLAKVRGVSEMLNRFGYETWESYSRKDRKPLKIVKLGAGNFGYCYLIEDITHKHKVVFKVAYEKGHVTDIDDREIKIGKQMSMMCLGPLRRKTPLASPYMTRIYGSVRAQFVTPSFWRAALASKSFGGRSITKNNCMLLEYVPRYIFRVPKGEITVNKYNNWELGPKSAVSSPRSVGEFFQMMDGNHALCGHDWIRYILFQVIATISVFGRRFRHNDISPSNVMITPAEKTVWTFEFKVSKSRSVYFKIPHSFPFQVKIHDFGLTVDLKHGEELDREMLKGVYKCGSREECEKEKHRITKWRASVGLESIYSQYYDPYLFLWWANMGMQKNRGARDECEPFMSFMDRLGMGKFPGKEGRLTSQMQREADKAGSYKGFRMYTAIEMLQDDYFSPYHCTKAEFERTPISQRISIPFRYDENVPSVDVSACRSFMEPIRRNPNCGKTLLGTEIRTDLSVPTITAYAPPS